MRKRSKLSVILVLSFFIMSVLPLNAFAATFNDAAKVPAWAVAAVNELAAAGVLAGDENGNFNPLNNVTRAEAAKVIVAAKGLTLVNPATASFSDVEKGKWFYTYVETAKAAGIVEGNAGKFNPNAKVTRQELAKMFVAAEGTAVDANATLTYSDAAAVANWAVPYVAAAKELGLMVGANNKFNPTANAIRAELAQIGSNFLGLGVKALEVVSVNAINAKQLEVKFSTDVDETSAETAGNYVLTTASGTLTQAARDLQTDDKTVVLTLATAITTKTSVSVTVKNVQAEGDASVVAPIYTKVLVVEDKVAPGVASVKSETNSDTASTVEIKFTEPVTSYSVKIDGTVRSGVLSDNDTKLTISGLNLDSAKAHTLTVINLTDSANNVSSLITKEFAITKDDVKPEVASVQQYADNAVLVTFSEAMDTTTINGNITGVDGALAALSLGTVVADPADDTDTKFIVPISTTLYSGDTKTATVTLSFNTSIEDELGNTMKQVTKQLSLTKDTTAPTITSVVAKKNSLDEVVSLTVKFSEAIAPGTYATANLITVVDKDGVNRTSGFFATNSDAVTLGDKEVVFQLASATELFNNYTFTFKKGLVQDAAETANDSVAYTKTINFGTPEASKFELTVGAVTYSSNVLTVAFGEEVVGGAVAGSATDVNNYTLNGAALPAGTTITLNTAKTTATITLADSGITKDDTAAAFRIANVKNAKGETIVPYVQAVGVLDNTAPVLLSARLIDNRTIELTYDENMADAAGANVGKEFVIKVGNTELVLLDTAIIADDVPGFAKKVKLTFATALDVDKTITIKTVDDKVNVNNVTDASNADNAQKADVTVTVVK